MTDSGLRKPKHPPSVDEISHDKLLRALAAEDPAGYPHWDKLRWLRPPEGLTTEEWWLGIKLRRRAERKMVPLFDVASHDFGFSTPDPIPRMIHQIDLASGGRVEMPDQITNPATRDRYYIASLVQEAITSSQLEGAVTTRELAKELLRTGRPPRDEGEQMILNNYETMKRLSRIKDQYLTPELVDQIHGWIARSTLADPDDEGRRRSADRDVDVADIYNEVYHIPPPADELDERMEALCAFANGRTPDAFVHPVIRAIILHFWLAYDHPYVDGNGRTARALFYWSMLKHGYWLFEFISISQVILDAPKQYYRAFLYTESDENDLTYFILHQLRVIDRAIGKLHEYIAKKTREVQAVERLIRTSSLNHRQRALLSHALRHPDQPYTTQSHQGSQRVSYQTARNDLVDLQNRGLLTSSKIGKTDYFRAVPSLAEKLKETD